ncbi:hypothetical protein MASR2M78_25360 [Treponema sp.]
MEMRPDDLFGMEIDAAKEYIGAHIASLKLTEKKLVELNANLERWERRFELARNSSDSQLISEAMRQTELAKGDRDKLAAEKAELEEMIERMKSQLPTLASRNRSVDPDLLEQELLMAAGRMPGEEDAAATERKFAKLEKEADVAAALEALKAKMAIHKTDIK